MKIVRLIKQQQEAFSHMDPFMKLERLDDPGVFALAAAEENEVRETYVPAGLMICAVRDDRICVIWLYVEEKFRWKGVGDSLLSAAADLAVQKGLPYVSASMPEDYGQELICRDAEEYLREHLFLQEETTADGRCLTAEAASYHKDMNVSTELSCVEYESELDRAIQQAEGFPAEPDESRAADEKDFIVKLKDIEKCELLKADKASGKVESIGGLSLEKLERTLKICNDRRPCTWFAEDITALPVDWFDPDLSCCMKTDDNIEGILLIHPESAGMLWIEYLYVMGPEQDTVNMIMHMLRFTAGKALEEYPPETEIVIRRHTEEIERLTQKLFPQHQSESTS